VVVHFIDEQNKPFEFVSVLQSELRDVPDDEHVHSFAHFYEVFTPLGVVEDQVEFKVNEFSSARVQLALELYFAFTADVQTKRSSLVQINQFVAQVFLGHSPIGIQQPPTEFCVGFTVSVVIQ